MIWPSVTLRSFFLSYMDINKKNLKSKWYFLVKLEKTHLWGGAHTILKNTKSSNNNGVSEDMHIELATYFNGVNLVLA